MRGQSPPGAWGPPLPATFLQPLWPCLRYPRLPRDDTFTQLRRALWPLPHLAGPAGPSVASPGAWPPASPHRRSSLAPSPPSQAARRSMCPQSHVLCLLRSQPLRGSRFSRSTSQSPSGRAQVLAPPPLTAVGRTPASPSGFLNRAKQLLPPGLFTGCAHHTSSQAPPLLTRGPHSYLHQILAQMSLSLGLSSPALLNIYLVIAPVEVGVTSSRLHSQKSNRVLPIEGAQFPPLQVPTNSQRPGRWTHLLRPPVPKGLAMVPGAAESRAVVGDVFPWIQGAVPYRWAGSAGCLGGGPRNLGRDRVLHGKESPSPSLPRFQAMRRRKGRGWR